MTGRFRTNLRALLWAKTILAGSISLVLLVFMFVGGPDYSADRIVKHLWNLGHVFAFFLWTWLLLHRPHWPNHLPPIIRSLIFVGAAFGASLLIEGIQFGLGRSAGWQDIGRNLLGVFLALWWVSPVGASFGNFNLWLGRLLSVVLLGLALMPLGRSLVDTYAAWRQFPVLADFETAHELERWSGDARFKRSEDVSHSGRKALKVFLTTDTFSGVILDWFFRDWSTYQALEISLYNPDDDSIAFSCRIHDRLHIKNQQPFEDRFTRRFAVDSGWNRIRIPLEDVRQAPQDRRMDMETIMAVGLFASQLDQPRIIYIDAIRLLR